MMVIDGYDITVSKGDSIGITFEFYNTDGTKYILSQGEEVEFTIAKSLMDANVNGYVITRNLSNAGENYITVSIDPDETEDLTPGEYVYNIRIVYNNTVFTPYPVSKFMLQDTLPIINENEQVIL